MSIVRSQLVENLAARQEHISSKDAELAVRLILDEIGDALARGDRVEIRGFGSFSTHRLPSRTGRNPKTGESVPVPAKDMPRFKPGKELRERVNHRRSGKD